MSLLSLKPMIVLALLAVLAVSAAVCCRNSPWRRPTRREERQNVIRAFGPYDVDEATTGASLRVKGGIRGRREQEIRLAGIAAPAPGDRLADESRENLERLAGQSITVEVRDPAVLRKRNVDGLVYGESGICLQVQQLRDGLAWYDLSDDPHAKEYREAMAEAKKARRGIWQTDQH